jgi:hypothetical protein
MKKTPGQGECCDEENGRGGSAFHGVCWAGLLPLELSVATAAIVITAITTIVAIGAVKARTAPVVGKGALDDGKRAGQAGDQEGRRRLPHLLDGRS